MNEICWSVFLADLFLIPAAYNFASDVPTMEKGIKKKFFILLVAFIFAFPLLFLAAVISENNPHAELATGISFYLLFSNATALGFISGLLESEDKNDDSKKLILYKNIALCITIISCIVTLCVENIYIRLFHIFINIILGIVWYNKIKKNICKK